MEVVLMTTKLDAMDRLLQFDDAYKQGSIAGMARAAGLTDKLVKDMSIEEIGDAISVRIADLLRIARTEGSTND